MVWLNFSCFSGFIKSLGMTCSNIEKSFKGSNSIIILLNEFEDRFLLQQINNHFAFATRHIKKLVSYTISWVFFEFFQKSHCFKTCTNLEIKKNLTAYIYITINSMLCTCPNWRGQYSSVLPCMWVQLARVWSLLLESVGRREPWQHFFLPW